MIRFVPVILSLALSASVSLAQDSAAVRGAALLAPFKQDNASPAWVAPILEGYLADREDRRPRVASLADDRIGYVEPILLQPLCLGCHGAALAPEVEARIDALYPDDQATGFEVGELRGVFWVEFPAHP